MSVVAGAERRQAISRMLSETNGPVSAAALAAHFSVSRQIIVGDIALLRAAGEDITATPRGYVASRKKEGVVCRVACIHTPEQIGEELYAIVDAGGEAVDVVVEHSVYGQLTGPLRIRSRYDVEAFLRRLGEHGAKPLSDLTDGVHLHTIRCPDEETCQRVKDALRLKGFLFWMP